MKCAGCGIESKNEKFFHTVRRTFTSKARSLCPACFLDKDDAVLKTMFWSFSGLGLVGLLLVFAFPRLVVGIWLLNIGVVLGVVLASTVLHEMGHAAAGTLAGHRMFSIEIGKGATVLEFKWLGVRWRFRTILFGGIVRALPKRRNCYRVKQSLFILGGPVATVLLALIAWKFLWVDKLLEPSPIAGFGPMGIILLSNSLLLAFSLWPHRGISAHGKIPNDALLLWQTWRQDRAKIAATFSYSYLFEADECCRDRKFTDAQKWLGEGLCAFPGNHLLAFSAATTLIFENKLDEARNALRALLTELADDPNLFPLLLNNIAYVDALLGRPELLPEADDFSRRALESAPWTVYFKGTRGIVLVELGRFEEGVALLEDALRKHPEKWGKAINACYLGIAATRRGYPSECLSYFAMARRLDPHCPLLDREKKPPSNALSPSTGG
ncbi:MAG: site-2 protease family protein [Verrucomicrobiota bacterium]|jgi:tetratricopeptide (TPR) repeat protein